MVRLVTKKVIEKAPKSQLKFLVKFGTKSSSKRAKLELKRRKK